MRLRDEELARSEGTGAAAEELPLAPRPAPPPKRERERDKARAVPALTVSLQQHILHGITGSLIVARFLERPGRT